MRTIRVTDEIYNSIREYQKVVGKHLTTIELMEKLLQQLGDKDEFAEIVKEKLEMIKNENRKKDT